jgi:hypothetical protein
MLTIDPSQRYGKMKRSDNSSADPDSAPTTPNNPAPRGKTAKRINGHNEDGGTPAKVRKTPRSASKRAGTDDGEPAKAESTAKMTEKDAEIKEERGGDGEDES